MFLSYTYLNYSELKRRHPDTKIYGLELIPYADKDYHKLKSKIEHYLDEEELKVFNDMDFSKAWEYYFTDKNYFAPNVPHGVIITKLGYVPSEFLTYR